MGKEYDTIIVDVVNLAYTITNEKTGYNTSVFNSKKVYPELFCNFIKTMDNIKNTFLKVGGEIIYLFDNYHSREELQKILIPLQDWNSRKKFKNTYKANRTKQKADFYNTLELLRYWFLVGEPSVHTARIPNLEADDLVKPVLSLIREKNPSKRVLFITNDSDWCRYLDEKTHYLPKLDNDPVTVEDFIAKWEFTPTEGSIVLYKILYGDSADNIQVVFPEFSSTLKNKILKNFISVEDFLLNPERLPELHSFTPLIKDRERDIKIAYQLLTAIPVSYNHILRVFTTGRQSKVVKNQLYKIMYPHEDSENSENSFSFGVDVPRYIPNA